MEQISHLQKIIPILLSQFPEKKEWSIMELVQVMGRQSGTNHLFFEQNSFTLRRKKSVDSRQTPFEDTKGIDCKKKRKQLLAQIDCVLISHS